MTHLDPFTDYTINEQYDRMLCRMICSVCGRDETAPGHVLREAGWQEHDNGNGLSEFCPAHTPYRSKNVCAACFSFSPAGAIHDKCLAEIAADLDDINSFVPHGSILEFDSISQRKIERKRVRC